MKRVGIILGICAVIGLGFATAYFFCGHCSLKEGKVHGSLVSPGLLKDLALTQDQQKQITPWEAALENDLSKLQTDLAKERMAICAILRSQEPDPKQLDRYTTRVSVLEARQQRRVLDHLLAVRTVLTQEQKEKFFASIMHEVCQNCQASANLKDCLCGMCGTKEG